jgi:hypothetical protein
MENFFTSVFEFNHPFHLVNSLIISFPAPFPDECNCQSYEDGHAWSYSNGEGSNHTLRCGGGSSEAYELERATG